MPPGKMCAKPPAKVIEKHTAEACLAIALEVHRARQLSGDQAGADAAQQVARFIQQGLLGAG